VIDLDDISQDVVKLLKELSQSATLPEEIKNDLNFKALWKCLDTDEYVKYSPISQFAFEYTEISAFQQALSDAVEDSKDVQNCERAYHHFLKIIDHLALVGIQGRSMDDRQEEKIKKQREELEKLRSNISSSTQELKSIKNDIKNLTNKLTMDFVTILGIFTSITFATFGGLQLLGNVFGKITNTSRNTVGSEIMLGAVFLFGTYLILIALLTGLSKLIGRDYVTSFPTKLVMLYSFSLIFIFGLLYANCNWIPIILSHRILTPAVILVVIVIPVVGDWLYYHFKKFIKKG
jgi:hypothetical protein